MLQKQSKPIQRKTPLKRSTKPIKRSPIKQKTYEEAKAAAQAKQAKTAAKPKVKKTIGPSKRPMAKLKAEADKWFSLYVRYRDGRYSHARGWETICITCSKWNELKKMQAGHFVSRTISELRFDEENVNGQCYGCNVMQNGQLHIYYEALDVKYGEGTAARLLARRVITHKLKRDELEQIITDAKTCIEHFKKQEEPAMANKPKPKKPTEAEKETKKPLNTAITNADEPANKKYKRRKINVVQK